eukprot:70380_1
MGSCISTTRDSHKQLKEHQLIIHQAKIECNLTVFNDQNVVEEKCHTIEDCTAIKRLTCGLQYYSILDIMKNTQHQDMLKDFFSNIYKNMFNDLIHLTCNHTEHLYEIKKMLIHKKSFSPCEISRCDFTLRHNESFENDESNVLDQTINLYKETMDSLHFYVFHLYDCGLRTVAAEISKDLQQNTKAVAFKENDEYFDVLFSKIIKNVEQKKPITNCFHRFVGNKKFNINPNFTDKENILKYSQKKSNYTYLDELMKYLRIKCISANEINKFENMIHFEEYDSEAIVDDLDDNDEASNIQFYVNHPCVDQLKKVILNNKRNASAFSIGFRFYYWVFYKSRINSPDEEHTANNQHHHSGYDISDLYIEKKYESFKEEILHYKFLHMANLNKVVAKVTQYENTDIFKKTTAAPELNYSKLHYGINEGSTLGVDHLISLILYTDFSELSADFSSTFRKLIPFESLSSVKVRNREYYWMSRLLREAVEVFGQCGSSEKKVHNGGLIGPFYSGISMTMTVPEFNIRLCSPTSTSAQIEIAIRFTGENGMIMQFNNNVPSSKYLRGFNCSWVSRYKEEDERLHFGGLFRIKIESIRLCQTNENFCKFIIPLFYFDAMLTGGNMRDLKINSAQCNVILSLIKWKLTQQTDKKFNKYVYDTFECFCRNKKKISLKFDELVSADQEIVNLIMHNIEAGYDQKGEFEQTNLFRKQLFDIFPNLQTVVLQTSCGPYEFYSFSLFGLLKLIHSTQFKQIIIKARYTENWITSLWSSSASIIQEKYNQHDVHIWIKHVSFQYGEEDWLMVDVI